MHARHKSLAGIVMTRGMANFIDFYRYIYIYLFINIYIYIYHFELLKWRNIEGVSEAAADGWRADRKWEGLVEGARDGVREGMRARYTESGGGDRGLGLRAATCQEESVPFLR